MERKENQAHFERKADTCRVVKMVEMLHRTLIDELKYNPMEHDVSLDIEGKAIRANICNPDYKVTFVFRDYKGGVL